MMTSFRNKRQSEVHLPDARRLYTAPAKLGQNDHRRDSLYFGAKVSTYHTTYRLRIGKKYYVIASFISVENNNRKP